MHNAPSVSYPVGRCTLSRQLWAAQSVISALLLTAWAWQQPISLVWGVALVGMIGASLSVWQEWHGASGELCWDGHRWRWQSAASVVNVRECIGEVKIVLDAQKALLLKWQPASDTLPSKVSWLWLAKETCPARWQDVRRAVYSPRRQ